MGDWSPSVWWEPAADGSVRFRIPFTKDYVTLDPAAIKAHLFPIPDSDKGIYTEAFLSLTGAITDVVDKKIRLSFVEPFLLWYSHLEDVKEWFKDTTLVSLARFIENPDSLSTMTSLEWRSLARMSFGLQSLRDDGVLDAESELLINEMHSSVLAISGKDATALVDEVIKSFPPSTGGILALQGAAAQGMLKLKAIFHFINLGMPAFGASLDTSPQKLFFEFMEDLGQQSTDMMDKIGDGGAPMMFYMMDVATAIGNNMDVKYATHLVAGKGICDIKVKVNAFNSKITEVIEKCITRGTLYDENEIVINVRELREAVVLLKELKDEVEIKSLDEWGKLSPPRNDADPQGIWKDIATVERAISSLPVEVRTALDPQQPQEIVLKGDIKKKAMAVIQEIGDAAVDLDSQTGSWLRSNAEKLKIIQTELSTMISFVTNFMNRLANVARAILSIS